MLRHAHSWTLHLLFLVAIASFAASGTALAAHHEHDEDASEMTAEEAEAQAESDMEAAEEGKPYDPEQDWNQEVVTAVAKSLHTAIADLRSTVRSGATGAEPRNQSRIRVEALDTLRQLERTTNSLASALEKGDSRESTIPQMRRIRMLRDDAADLARRAAMRTQVQAKLAHAGGIVKELEFYYGDLES